MGNDPEPWYLHAGRLLGHKDGLTSFMPTVIYSMARVTLFKGDAFPSFLATQIPSTPSTQAGCTPRTSGETTRPSTTVQAKHDHACYLDFNLFNAAQDRRGKTARRAWPEQRPCYLRCVYMLVHGLCRRQHITSPPCMENAKRRPETTTKQLNPRCPAVLSAGVINRELSEAPGTRRAQSPCHVGRASRPPRSAHRV